MIDAGQDVAAGRVVRPAIGHQPHAALVDERQLRDQLRRLVAVLGGHHQPQRRAVFRAERFAVHADREQRARVQQVFQLHEVVVLVGAIDPDPEQVGLGADQPQQLLRAKAFPVDAARPALHALEAAALGNARQLVEVGELHADAGISRAFDGEVPLARIGSGDGIERHHLQVEAIRLVGRDDPAVAAPLTLGLRCDAAGKAGTDAGEDATGRRCAG